jgi:molybdenum cofactor cytidylyltransferase
MSERTTAAIILAAGTSSRIGEDRHKLLLPLGDRPVIAHVLDAVLASQARPVLLVLGHRSAQLRAVLAPYLAHPEVHPVDNPHYQQGMSTSIHAGITELAHLVPDCDSALIMLGDQPLLSAAILDTLIEARHTTHSRIIAPLYQGQRGNPVLFERNLFPELREVQGDEGGRAVLTRHRTEVTSIELGSTHANYDVDTWDAYEAVVKEWHKQHPSDN